MEDMKLLETIPQQITYNTEAAPPFSSPVRGGLAPHKLQKVLAYIDERVAEAVGVRDLAMQVHMSPFHFARRFKQAVRTPPHPHITHVRIARAKRLLAGTNLPPDDAGARGAHRHPTRFTRG